MNAIALEKCNPETRIQTTDSKQMNLLEIILLQATILFISKE